MPARFPLSRTLGAAAAVGITSALLSLPLWGQKPAPRSTAPSSRTSPDSSVADLDVDVRDSRGAPLDSPALVHLYSTTMTYNFTSPAKESSTAHFSNVRPGDYELEVTSPGYRQITEHLSLMGSPDNPPIYVYMVPETETTHTGEPPRGVVMTPQLRSEVEKGVESLNKKQYEAARKIFTKALQKAPGNPDIIYLLGVAELGLLHIDLARENFQRALSLDPNHELALVSLGEMQLHAGAPTDAIISLEKAIAVGRAGWRAHFDLAFAYLKASRLSDAESEAARAAHLAKVNGATPLFLLGAIQYAEGKRDAASRTWQSILTSFSADPIVPETKKMLVRLENETLGNGSSDIASLPLPSAPETSLVGVAERPWAPPDIDSAAYNVAPDVNCRTDQILEGAMYRLKSELIDFEKFTATEHIEHQEIDRYGWPGPVKARDFSYVVFVHRSGDNSFYLTESRSGGNDLSTFPTRLATTGLNSLAVSVLQLAHRGHFNYSCEGLTNLRGQAAWQLRFEERRDPNGGGVRSWQWGGKTYEVPVKGRIWVSSASFAVLRIETDLREPIAELELTRDHLIVDYGPVDFSSGNVQLWLPWSGDMYVALHGKRYHHRHFLSEYLLFGVDTTQAIGKPKEIPQPPAESSP
jgi:tetratricopeptide (TPR) repeat protein